ncbi:MAG: hypothetical protein LBI27_09415 [Clostridiales bacterium]|jgi:hypothetical protein|nr:hypothetical protein [Clostridiales bacterium]
MDISSVSQLISGSNNNQGNQNDNDQGNNSVIPGMPNTGAGTDFGAAGTYRQGEQATEPESYVADMQRVGKMWEAHNARVESFRQMVETLLGKQAEKQGIAEFPGNPNAPGRVNFPGRNGMIEVTDEMRAEAQKEIDEGGYFSVDETAKRLLNFAVALTGGDPSKVELMRDAVIRGYEQAEKQWGGELPEITKKTHEAVMKGFDEWAAAGSASAITLLNKE